ncbi:MAG: DNA-3-methyladenine glycosylase I [Pirellulaceae bacterium]|nr:DNA-3-methyladenine glycosylase I [Pirellulaceae bacterium]
MPKPPPSTLCGDDGKRRCWWCGSDPLYVQYHDTEWGIPVDDDQRLFEKMCLEGFQSGLSWLTVLKKRESFRRCFDQFDFYAVARYRPAKVETLLQDARIIRHRGKIESTINNAKRAIEIVDQHGSLAAFFWQFEPSRPRVARNRSQIPAITDESTALSKSLKKRGWSFVGPTTCYALMQAMGMVNDHVRTCHAWEPIEQARRAFERPEFDRPA